MPNIGIEGALFACERLDFARPLFPGFAAKTTGQARLLWQCFHHSGSIFFFTCLSGHSNVKEYTATVIYLSLKAPKCFVLNFQQFLYK